MEFVFDSEIKPKQENFSSLDDLEKNLFKKVKDVNGSNKYYRDIYSGLNDIIQKNMNFQKKLLKNIVRDGILNIQIIIGDIYGICIQHL
jgi:predicted metalloprotease with PDZ domain